MKRTPKGRPSGEFEFQLAPLLAAILALPTERADRGLKHLLVGLATFWLRNPDCAENREGGRVMLAPPKEHIADAAGRSVATITRAIRAVRNAGGGGFVEIEGSNNAAHRYILDPQNIFATPDVEGCQNGTEGCHLGVSKMGGGVSFDTPNSDPAPLYQKF